MRGSQLVSSSTQSSSSTHSLAQSHQPRHSSHLASTSTMPPSAYPPAASSSLASVQSLSILQCAQSSESYPRPYRGRSTPFPIAVGKRTVGGLAALDEYEGAEVLSQLFGNRKAQPTPLGKTRCYWALFSTESSRSRSCDLTFLFCDPVLQNHLNEEADLIIGKSFFDFVHPDEKDQARRDLAQIVASGTLFGSVTRCRYTRLPAIRERLGCLKAFRVPGSDLISNDEEYLTIDIVLNMVGASLALGFFHAIINKSVQDNDETNKTDWTNWCGTPRALFDVDQCNKLWTSVATLSKPSPPLLPTAPHIFQILSLPEDNSSPEILFSWPPPRFFPDDNPAEHYASTILDAFEDGSYFADEFARLAQGVRTSPSARTENGQTARNGDPGTIRDGANTSCTRRFRAKHTLTTEGMLRSIESVLVPYGTIMLACFTTRYQQIMTRSCGGSYSESALHSTISTASSSASSFSPSGRHGFVGPFASPSQITPAIDSLPYGQKRSSVRGERRGDGCRDAIGSPRLPMTSQDIAAVLNDPSLVPSGTLSGTKAVEKGGNQRRTAVDKAEEELQAHKRPKKRGRKSEPGHNGTQAPLRSLEKDTLKGLIDGCSCPDKRCTSCGTPNSPEWRKGPSGLKTLCNACGLRFSRSINRQQKKAEKKRIENGAATAAACTTPSAGRVEGDISLSPGKSEKDEDHIEPFYPTSLMHTIYAAPTTIVGEEDSGSGGSCEWVRGV